MSLIGVSLVAMLLGTTGGNIEAGAVADIHVEDRVEYYRIAGSTPHELAAQMALLGPVRSMTGRRAAGYTHSELLWEHSKVMHEGVCQLEYLDMRVTIVTTLPVWTPPTGRLSALAAQWRRFMASLREHEATHRLHGLQAAAAARQAILAIPPHADCEGLERAVRLAARGAMRRYAAESRKYDALTGFGAKQGVRLTPL